MSTTAPSAARIALALAIAVLAFGAAFAVAKATAGGDHGPASGVKKIEAPSYAPKVPGFASPATLPPLRAAPSHGPRAPSGGSAGGGRGSTPPPASPPPSRGGGGGGRGGSGGGGGTIIQG
jgi:hypothetical protein